LFEEESNGLAFGEETVAVDRGPTLIGYIFVYTF
jgi:hypothetical protein